MGTSTLLSLDQKLLETMGDYKSNAVTTAIAASALLVSTNFQKYRATADYFNGYWAYIVDLANAGISRYVSDDDGTSTLTVLGANLASDGANLATVRLSKFAWEDRVLAINQALPEIYPAVYVPIDNTNLVTGNILPDSSFEEWTSTSALSWYTATNITLLKTSTAANVRGIKGTYSAKCTASAGNGYVYISSDSYPKLLDLAGQTINFRSWAYPEVANDAYLVIYTIKADGTAQTLTSTTTSPAGKWSLLELNGQTINEDIVKIEFRFGVTTNAKYVYYDSAVVTGGAVVNEYLLPSGLESGGVNQVYIGMGGGNTSDYSYDDIASFIWQPNYNWEIVNDGSNSYLKFDSMLAGDCRIRLIGSKPLEALTASTDTISTNDTRYLQLVSNYAAYRLYSNASSTTSGSDKDKFNNEANRYLSNYYRLAHLKMTQKPVQLKVPNY